MVVLLIACGSSAFAWDVNVAWDDFLNDPALVSGYYLYYRRPALGETTYSIDNRIDVGDNLLFSVTGMQSGLEYCFVATAHTADTPPLESGYSNEACAKPKPTATITNPVDGTTVSGTQLVQVSVTDPDDAAGVQSVTFQINTTGTWNPMPWNAASQLYEANWNTAIYAGQSVELTAISVDPTGFISDPTSITVTVGNNRLHVGDLDGSATRGSPWKASVVIQVHNQFHAPVANATVNGSWKNVSSSTKVCVTDAAGQCTLTAKINKKFGNTVFTVTRVRPGVYESAMNHDPDGDSNGTSITIVRP